VREKGATRMYCVSCDVWVMREKDMNEQQKQQQEKLNQTADGNASAATGANGKSLQQLEAGLASLSDHALYDRFADELRTKNEQDMKGANGSGSSTAPSTASSSSSSSASRSMRASSASSSTSSEEFELVPRGDDGSSPQRIEARMKHMDSVSAKIGAKMLAGWTLMAESCPESNCGCPLMSQKNKPTEIVCANCGAALTKKGDEIVVVKSGSVGGAAPLNSTRAPPTATARPAWTSASRLRAKGPRKTRRQREEEEDDDEEDEVDGESKQDLDVSDPYRLDELPADLSQPLKRNAAPANTSSSSSSSRRSDEVSALLGQKMLQGYALLAQHCPREECMCPLVRKKDGPMFCVSCGSTVVDESDYDEATHGPADDHTQTRPRARSTEHRDAATGSAARTTPTKRLASPNLAKLVEEDQNDSKKARSSEEPSPLGCINKSVSFMRGSIESPCFGSTAAASDTSMSNSSSGLPSPTAYLSRSRATSMDMESAEAAVDPRLRLHAQLGGKSGRFKNPPHSRAPSFALPNANTFKHTSSAALSAAAQMAFNARHGEIPPELPPSAPRSASSSVEQSPRTRTPPATPIVPSFNLALGGAGSSFTFQSLGQSHGHTIPRPPLSRHPSSASPSSALAPLPPVPFEARGSYVGPSPLAKSTTPTSPLPSLPLPLPPPASDGTSLSHASTPYHDVLLSVQLTLVRKLEECRQQLSSCSDLQQCREIMATMRELVETMQFIKQGQNDM